MTQKRLKNSEYRLVDTSIACAGFIIFQLLYELFYNFILPQSLKANLLVAILCSILVEGIFFLAAFLTAKIQNVEFVNATKIAKKIDATSFGIAILISILCLFGYTGLTNIFVTILNSLGYKQMVSDITIPNFATYLLYVVIMCICPAVFEETLFRGCILNGLKEKMSNTKAIWLSALIFMLMHGGPDQTVHQLLIGAICGYALIYSGSLLVPIVIHFVNNFTAITMLYFSSGTSSEAEVATSTSAGSIILSLVYTLIMAAAATYCIILLLKKLKELKEKRENTTPAAEPKAETTLLEVNDETLVTATKIEEVQEPTALSQQGKSKAERTITIALYAFSFAYLIFNWVTTLIQGFLI